VLSREGIERVLTEDLDRARQAYDTASREFKTVTLEIPSGLPHPDGTDRIRIMGDAYNSAMKQYAVALQEFNAFVTHRVVPERLKGDATA
jgi:hypothetical protein